MTPADLRAWIKSTRLSHQEAANLLAMSVSGLRHNLYGQKPISKQTALIVELYVALWEMMARERELRERSPPIDVPRMMIR